MNSVKRSLKFLNIDLKSTYLWFWGVMLFVNIGSYIANYKLGSASISIGFQLSDTTTETFFSVAGANIIAIIIFFIAHTYEIYYQYFPLAIGFSTTRKDFYKSVMIRSIMISFTFSVIQTLLFKLDVKVIQLIGRNPYVDYIIFNTLKDNSLYIGFSLFIIFLCIISGLNLLASLNYRFGFWIWIVMAIIFIGSSFFIRPSIFIVIGKLLSPTRLDLLQYILLLITTLVPFGLGYLVIKETNIKVR